MRKHKKKEKVRSLLVLVLFAVFSVCVLSVLLMGAEVVQRITERDQGSYDHRTAAQFVTTKVRQADVADMIFAGDFFQEDVSMQGDTLFLTSVLEGETYCTKIYCRDGYLWELLSQAGGRFLPEDGEKIMKLHDLHFSMEDRMLYAELKYEDGQMEQIALHLRSGGRAA